MEYLILFILGLVVGSFLNVLIDRLPKGEEILFSRSHCDHCRKPLRWFELVPVGSYLIQAGRCRRCHRKISLQYPLIELATAMMFLSVNLLVDKNIFFALALASALLVIFVADLKYQIIPDSMLVLGLVSSLFLPVFSLSHFLSAVLATFFFYLLYLITKRRGMGFGDVKLAFLLGLLLGWPFTLVAFYVAFLTGAITGVILILVKNKSLKSQIAFGPFLILGTVVALVWGQAIINFWHSLL